MHHLETDTARPSITAIALHHRARTVLHNIVLCQKAVLRDSIPKTVDSFRTLWNSLLCLRPLAQQFASLHTKLMSLEKTVGKMEEDPDLEAHCTECSARLSESLVGLEKCQRLISRMMVTVFHLPNIQEPVIRSHATEFQNVLSSVQVCITSLEEKTNSLAAKLAEAPDSPRPGMLDPLMGSSLACSFYNNDDLQPKMSPKAQHSPTAGFDPSGSCGGQEQLADRLQRIEESLDEIKATLLHSRNETSVQNTSFNIPFLAEGRPPRRGMQLQDLPEGVQNRIQEVFAALGVSGLTSPSPSVPELIPVLRSSRPLEGVVCRHLHELERWLERGSGEPRTGSARLEEDLPSSFANACGGWLGLV
eukprot:RCo023860